MYILFNPPFSLQTDKSLDVVLSADLEDMPCVEMDSMDIVDRAPRVSMGYVDEVEEAVSRTRVQFGYNQGVLIVGFDGNSLTKWVSVCCLVACSRH